MKTKAYRMEINVLDTIETTVPLTEKVYLQKLKSLKRQVAETQIDPDRESTFVAEDAEKVDEFETYTRKIYRATLGTTDIELIAVICKPGYCIK
jgi:hypothetical protein